MLYNLRLSVEHQPPDDHMDFVNSEPESSDCVPKCLGDAFGVTYNTRGKFCDCILN